MQYADPTKLRAYFFGNMYISPIQQGIQAAHVVTKLFQQYGRDNDGIAADALYDWADVGVTKILLNGGYQSNLADIHTIFEILAPKFGLPFAKFHEEEAALNGALTSVGIVVPEEVYDLQLVMLPQSVLTLHNKLGFLPEAIYSYTPDHATLYGYAQVKVMRAASTPQAILEIVRTVDIDQDEALLLLHLTLKTCRLA